MMNKKAIAAFAAGATLLAGFAMATPAFAADGGANTQSQEVKKSKADLKKELDTARANYEAAVAAEKAADEAATKAAAALQTVGAKPADANDGSVKIENGDNGHLKVTTTDDAKAKEKEAAEKYVKAYNDDADAKVAKTAAEQDKTVKATAYLAAEQAYANAPEPKPAPSEDDQKDNAIARVRYAKADLDTKRVKKSKTYAEYLKKKSALKAAMDEQTRCQKALDEANDAMTDFKTSGKDDSAAKERLQKRVNRAKSLLSAAGLKVTKAQGEYDDAKAKAEAAKDAWKLAAKEYEDAFEDAKALGVDPATLPLVSTAEDPLENDFSDVPGVLKVVEEAKAGKFGPEAQQAAQKAEAGKKAPAAAAGKAGAAAAKGELATKGGNGHKAGEKLGNAGVGVALTALAASMLAGMGAAVRKMRH
ncbi:hypothetical protein HXT31_05955 [Gardnerella sp. DNF00622A]|uniref:hypothetical protein n=1 Tax=Gardnerella sp. DNF00622A TaxID=2749053 RepID=UPI003BAEE9D2